MAIGQLPRLNLLDKEGIQDWSDKFAQRLEFLFASPRQIGILEVIQFTLGTGSLQIPTATSDVLMQWGSGAIATATSATAVAFPIPYMHTCYFVIPIGSGVNSFPYSASAVSITGFTANAGNSGTADTFNWFAIGS